jgi:hypothetical protein
MGSRSVGPDWATAADGLAIRRAVEAENRTRRADGTEKDKETIQP